MGGGILESSGNDVYSTLLFATPEGQCVAYRKRHPFFWERSICRAGSVPQVIHTPIGRIGLLMGADIAYDDSATAYADQVDLLLLSSSAALLPDGVVSLPDGRTMHMGQFHPAFAGRAAQMRYDYYGGVGKRAAAMHVPIVHAVQCGMLQSPLPMERVSLLYTLLHPPRQLSVVLGHGRASVSAAFLGHSAVFADDGRTLAAQPDDEGIIMAQIVPRATSKASLPQPPSSHAYSVGGVTRDTTSDEATCKVRRQTETVGTILTLYDNSRSARGIAPNASRAMYVSRSQARLVL